jgi:hypothetical protein
MRYKLTTALFTFGLLVSCNWDYNIQFDQFEGIKYKYEYPVEWIAGSRSLGHFIYVKNVKNMEEAQIRAFCIHYAKENPSISTLWIVDSYNIEGTEKENLRYRARFTRNQEGVQIKLLDKY